MPGGGFDPFRIGTALEDIVPAMVRVPYPGKAYLAPLRPIPIDLLLNQVVLVVDLLQPLALSDISDYFPVDPHSHPFGSLLWSEQVVHDSLVAVFLNDPLRNLRIYQTERQGLTFRECALAWRRRPCEARQIAFGRGEMPSRTLRIDFDATS